MASYQKALARSKTLLETLGEPNAHHIWALGLYLEEPDLEMLAGDALTDGPDDKKIDFLYLDRDGRRIILAQGFYGRSTKDSAPSNKAADLNTAGAWLLSGDIDLVPPTLRPAIQECRQAIADGEIDAIEVLYVHNLPESVNVSRELQTAVSHLRRLVEQAAPPLAVQSRELGSGTIEQLFLAQESHIEVNDAVVCPAGVLFTENGPTWEAAVLSVPGIWLHELFNRYGATLFSANYRGFLGITRRRRINTGIRQSAETRPADFWVFNNGITVLTRDIIHTKDSTTLTGISVINGAQTTGSIGSVELARHDLKGVRVLCRAIKCNDDETINDIVKYNNTQNEITTWDQYSNDPEQNRIADEFRAIGHSYAKKRGFRAQDDALGIEEVAQPLLAFHGRWDDASRGKNRVFERKPLYDAAFAGKKARHILFVFALARAIDERRIELKNKSNAGQLISIEESQLELFRILRFKNFVVAVTARVLETIVGSKIDAETIAFSPEAATASKRTLNDLVAVWGAVVQEIISVIAATVSAAELPGKLTTDGYVEDVARKVAALMYSNGAAARHKDFTGLLADS